MNKVIFSRWEPILFSSAEFYLDNQDVVVIPYKDLKCNNNTFKSLQGIRYKAIYDDNNTILAFEILE